jgi:putative nucleotidyltransferase with HDIG domain
MNFTKTLLETIGSGDFRISKSRVGGFQCFLGTCAGVSLVDRVKNVGGVYHIILPAPIEIGNVWEPKNYASTGMPLFLQAMLDNGADKQNLEAVISGGALIGNLSRRDLDLDLGGKTVEIALQFLKDNDINVIHSETGGYFSCRLALDLSNWETIIEPIAETEHKKVKKIEKLTNKQIDQTISRLKPIPQVALKVLRMMNSADYEMYDIASEIRKDQILSAKVINLSNSAFFNPRFNVNSVDQALIRLGEKRLLQIILSSSIELFFQDSSKGYSLCKGGLYHHSINTAMATENLAKMSKAAMPDVAYTAGLLHDIGKVVLDQYVAIAYPFFYRQIYDDEKQSVEVEENIMGISHPITGERLARLWELPDQLIDVIKYHHTPQKAEIDQGLVHLVYISDLLISRFRVGNELERIDAENLLESLEIIGLDITELPLVIDTIPWTMFNEESSTKDKSA